MIPYPTNRFAMIYEAIGKSLRSLRGKDTWHAIVLRRKR